LRVEFQFRSLSVSRQIGDFVQRLGIKQARIEYGNNLFLVLDNLAFDRIRRWRFLPIANIQEKAKHHRLTIEILYRVLRTVVGHLAQG